MTSAQPHETRVSEHPSRGQNQPMSTEHRSARKGTDPRPNYLLLGTDAEGRDHVYRTYAEEVVIVRDGQRTHVEDLAAYPGVDSWLQLVADRIGWADVAYGMAAIETLDFEWVPWGETDE